jgi:hypothetical protein
MKCPRCDYPYMYPRERYVYEFTPWPWSADTKYQVNENYCPNCGRITNQEKKKI